MSYDEIMQQYPSHERHVEETAASSNKKSGTKKDKPFWQDSPDIVTLHEYLAANRDVGATVVLSMDNEPALRFEPGLSLKDDKNRWAQAQHALFLFALALPDIKFLMKFNLIKIPHGWTSDGLPLLAD